MTEFVHKIGTRVSFTKHSIKNVPVEQQKEFRPFVGIGGIAGRP